MNSHEHHQLLGDVEISELTDADFNDFKDIELLELLLGSFMTWEYSQGLSRICQRRFGSLPNFVRTSSKSLHQAGLSWRIILTIKLILAISVRINNQMAEKPLIVLDQMANRNN